MDDTPLTRNMSKTTGVSLAWNRQLDDSNSLVASTSEGVEPAQQSSSEQEKISINIYEPIDEFLPQADPVDALAWDHSGDLDSPPVDDIIQAGAVDSSRWSTAINKVNTSCNQTDNTLDRDQFRPRLQGTSELEAGDQSVLEEDNSSGKEQ